MKKALLLLFVPIVAFATCEECQQTVSNLLDRASESFSMSASVQESASSIVNLQLPRIVRSLETEYPDLDFSTLSVSANTADFLAGEIINSNNVVQVRLDSIISALNNFSCDCESSSSCGCAEYLSEISSQLTSIESSVLSSASNIVVQIDAVGLLVESIINEDLPDIEGSLHSISNTLLNVVNAITNDIWNTSRQWTSFSSTSRQYYRQLGLDSNWNNFSILKSSISVLSTTTRATLAQIIRSYVSTLHSTLPSLNNYFYDYSYLRFPVLTNTVGTLTRESTNFFSFFRGEIGVHGVLEDWTAQKGTYHDFLTNHYIQVVTGGTLSGNQSAKTNWFSRIETLLAALVFSDTETTNTVDVSVGTQEREQLVTSYETANQTASVYSDNFKSTSQGIVALYRAYFNMFDNAALPSHVVLMSLSNIDSSGDVEISFQSDSLGVLVNACRVVTTFCWASVGIFMLYKFFVWASRCVIAACTFIYRAISSVFKS